MSHRGPSKHPLPRVGMDRNTPRQDQPKYTIEWAYKELYRDMCAGKVFSSERYSTEQMAWAFSEAHFNDIGHEREYPEGNMPSDGEWLMRLAYDNVRDWAEAFPQHVARLR